LHGQSGRCLGTGELWELCRQVLCKAAARYHQPCSQSTTVPCFAKEEVRERGSVESQDRDRIAEQLVEVFERYKLLDQRRAGLAHGGLRQERAQIDRAIKSVIDDFVKISYPLVRNTAHHFSKARGVEPEDLTQDVMAKRLFPRAERIMRVKANKPIAVVQNEIKLAILTSRRKTLRQAIKEEKLSEKLGCRLTITGHNTTGTEALALTNIDREELVQNFYKELALIETNLVSGADVCVFHPGNTNYLDHQLVAKVLRESRLAAAPADAFGEDMIDELHVAIKLHVSVDNSKTLSDRHYRCLDWFLYRLYRTTNSPYRHYAACRLAGRVKLQGNLGKLGAVWNRQSCQRAAAKVLWREYPDVQRQITKYLADKKADGHISDGDARRLIAELED